jgi:hypothetical protein
MRLALADTRYARAPRLLSLAQSRRPCHSLRTAVLASADAYLGLHHRVDAFGQPQQRGTAWAVQRELVAAVKQDVAQLREAALGETALEEPEAAERPDGIIIAGSRTGKT